MTVSLIGGSPGAACAGFLSPRLPGAMEPGPFPGGKRSEDADRSGKTTITRRSAAIPGVFALLTLALAGCSAPSSPPDPNDNATPTAPSGPLAPYTGYIKLEWGSLSDTPSIYSGQVSLEGAEVLEAHPFALEADESFDPETLSFATSEWDILTDGMLLAVQVEVGGRLEFRTLDGVVDVALDALNLEERDFALLACGTRYVEVSRISAEEWTTALSYAGRPTDRTDNLPEAAYAAYLPLSRYNSVGSQEQIYDESMDKYLTDAFFRNAEDLRRAVNQQLYVFAPSVVALGEQFDVTVVAFDVNGHLVNDFTGPVQLVVDGPGLSLPSSLSFPGGGLSRLTLAEAGMALKSGYNQIRAIDPSGRFAPGAIPVRVEEEPAERVFWGDLHTHSNLSDGDFADIGPGDVYAYGRDVGNLDFEALSDHDYRRPIPDWKWPIEVQAAADFYQPGRFVTLVGYEWSAEDMRFSDAISHKNVYFRSAEAPVYSAFDQRYNTPDKLWAALREKPGVGEALTIPHHPVRNISVSPDSPWYGGAGTDWNYHDEDFQTLVEVYSRWGISETNDPANPRPVKNGRSTGSGQYALSLGYRLGFIAGGDTHDGTPGVSVLPSRQGINPYPTGLTAVVAPALTREDVFDALYDRRCYGTSGGRRMLLDLRTTGGLRAGDIGELDGIPTFEITVAGTTALKEVALMRVDPSGPVTVWTGGASGWFLQTTVSDPGYPGDTAYYLRVTQLDNELGWLGPIFLTGS